MTDEISHINRKLKALRAKAEEQLKLAKPELRSEKILVPVELLHELRVHQIELKMQVEELHRAQVDLETSRNHYLELYDFAPVGYLALNVEGFITEINLTAAKLLGVERNKILNRRFAQFIDAANTDRWHRHFIYAKQTSGNHACELPLRNKEGNQLWLHLDCLSDAAYPLLRITLTDITERKQAENALLESEKRFSSFMHHLKGFAWIKDDAGRYVFANDAFEIITEKKVDQILGKTDEEIFGAETAAVFRANDRAAAQANSIGITGVEHFIDRNGIERYCLVSKFPITSDGQKTDTGGIAIDDTARVLADKKLREATEKLHDADRRKDEFLAMLGHELRNPLTPISNVAQTLGAISVTGTAMAKASEMLTRNVNHITYIVDDLLDVSRITRGLVTIDRHSLELGTLLKDTVESVQSFFTAKQQTVQLYIPPQPIYVNGDPVRLTQVFSNLLTNASKYTGEGGRIELRVDIEDPSVIVRVQDNGMGIEPQLLPYIFGLFTQGERSLARSEGGLGIGLTLVKKLVDLHGGKVIANSQGTNQGSEFVVKLPIHIKASAEVEPDHFLKINAETELGLRILLIDDNKDVLDSISLWLEMEGHRVETAINGLNGISMAQDFAPDMILLDIGMPDMDGYQVAKKLREQSGSQAPLIVAMSGYSPIKDESGFDHYLLKPPKLSDLQNLIVGCQRSKQIVGPEQLTLNPPFENGY